MSIGSSPLKALVAEDDPVSGFVMKRMLEKLNCVVDIALNGNDAVERANKVRYDIITMDCHMPLLDGVQATLAIRSGGGASAGTVIAAVTSSDERTQLLSCGMNHYLRKPVDWAHLRSLVDTIRSSSESE